MERDYHAIRSAETVINTAMHVGQQEAIRLRIEEGRIYAMAEAMRPIRPLSLLIQLLAHIGRLLILQLESSHRTEGLLFEIKQAASRKE